MKVMIFNIQHCLDYQNQVIDIPLFADFIAKQNVDICGLCEVRGEGNWEGYTDQTNALGDMLSMHRAFGEAIKVIGTNPYGNALLSKAVLLETETLPVPDPEDKSIPGHYESRCVLLSRAAFPEGELLIAVCHMGLMESEARNAVKVICDIADRTTLPMIVMGDFNHTLDSGILSPLLCRFEDSDEKAEKRGVYSFPSYSPREKIDYIFYRGLECRKARVVEEIVSDHYPVIAEFGFAK